MLPLITITFSVLTHRRESSSVVSDVEVLMLDVTLMSDIGYGMGSLFGLPSTVATTNYYFVNESLRGMLYFTKS